jgi:hypothetical protein
MALHNVWNNSLGFNFDCMINAQSKQLFDLGP